MYTISSPSGTLRKVGVIVAQDDRTPEFLEYVAWLSEGGGPEQIADAEPGDQAPATISALQIVRAMVQLGIEDVKAEQMADVFALAKTL